MKHLGDITRINGATIEPVDVVTGGSPCQDLSVAGKRAGLAGERSGLFMEQIRIIKEMRERDRSLGRTDELIRPRYMVWENVCGAFSSNGGEDFRAVLEETARVCDPNAHIPRPTKWQNAGCIMGAGLSIAWRVHDAQFWGVPQRRKRIALVADFAGFSAPEILFERKSLRGNSDESLTQGQGTALRAKDGTPTPKCLQIRAGCAGGGKGALVKDDKSAALKATPDQTLFEPVKLYGISPYHSNCMLSDNPHSGVYEADTSRTLDLNGGNPACNQGGIAVCEPMLCLNDQGGERISVSDGILGALRAQEHGHQPILLESNQNHATIQTDGVCTCLPAAMGMGGGLIPMVTEPWNGRGDCLVGNGQPDQLRMSDKVGALNCMHDQQAVMVYGMDRASFNQGKNAKYDFSVLPEQQPTLTAKGPGAVYNYMVRRLTPLECERLQGYPDGWTDIGTWTDSKGRKRECSDANRYKALGNSIALPFWKVLLKRITAQYDRDATLGSLFDGIGGFPLCWEQINGRGSARWASEIEEFPIAVTKYHFQEGE